MFLVYMYDGTRDNHGGAIQVDTYEELAQVIVSNQQDKVVTDELDLFLCSTMGSFLDRCCPEFREEFIPHLLKAQGVNL